MRISHLSKKIRAEEQRYPDVYYLHQMDMINWGIIGCGNVTEKKSGPAFNKVKNSRLVAVMRRDAVKAADYAKRHNVPKWYSDAADLINDPEVNAVYIATPPAYHEEYCMAVINAGKPVYVEKPMSLDYESATRMVNFAAKKNVKLSVAHYRRGQPFFKKIKQLLEENTIGQVQLCNLRYYKTAVTQEMLKIPGIAWRLDPATSGGGLFHDLAPHQLDLMVYLFGKVKSACGFSTRRGHLYDADDTVAGSILFDSGILFNGSWSFNVQAGGEIDECAIIGSSGSICFPVFNNTDIHVQKGDEESVIHIPMPEHVQQYLIQEVVDYFLDKGPNPTGGKEASMNVWLMDQFTGK